MTVEEIFDLAKRLSQQERKELIKLLIDTLDSGESTVQPSDQSETHWGKSLNQLTDEIDPIEMVDPHIEDPVEWVNAQRQKRIDQLKPYRDGDQ